MKDELSILIDRLSSPEILKSDVIPWATPVPSFGNLSKSKIATLGLNPSDKEFVDNYGNELEGTKRRFQTLKSLGISTWADVNETHLSVIWESCNEYFARNPYDGWFKKLDSVISGTSKSFYFPSNEACHLDLIPFATSCKWTDLTNEQKTTLLRLSCDTLGILLNQSPVRLLILNGQTVVDNLQKISSVKLVKTMIPNWSLPRKNGQDVLGYAYEGIVQELCGVKLRNEIMILGYNHNLQSSYGVTTKVQNSIGLWITEFYEKHFL